MSETFYSIAIVSLLLFLCFHKFSMQLRIHTYIHTCEVYVTKNYFNYKGCLLSHDKFIYYYIHEHTVAAWSYICRVLLVNFAYKLIFFLSTIYFGWIASFHWWTERFCCLFFVLINDNFVSRTNVLRYSFGIAFVCWAHSLIHAYKSQCIFRQNTNQTLKMMRKKIKIESQNCTDWSMKNGWCSFQCCNVHNTPSHRNEISEEIESKIMNN